MSSSVITSEGKLGLWQMAIKRILHNLSPNTVVSRDLVRICLTIADLNNLDVIAAVI